MPAPSPVFPSASTAPRWYKHFSASIAILTTSLEFIPLLEAIRPTPQEECSSNSL